MQGPNKDKMVLCAMAMLVCHIQTGCSSLCCGFSLDLDVIVILIQHEQNIFLEIKEKIEVFVVPEQYIGLVSASF